MNPAGYTTWLEIDLAAVRHNITRLREITATPIMAIVKANAYGHGLIEVSRAALAARASWLGVARFEEALMLRQAGIAEPILVLGYTHPSHAAEAARSSIRLCLFDALIADAYAEAARSAGGNVIVHVKVDSGMGRLGVSPGESYDFIRRVKETPGLNLEGLFTHFARSDEPDSQATAAQLTAFNQVLTELDTADLRPPWVHACNSAAAITLPAAHFNLVRCGIAIYGLDPSPECPLPPNFWPALSWKAILTSARNLPSGHGVGYGHWYVTTEEEYVGTIPVGYADGLRRVVPNEVLIHECKLPVFARVCMDQTILSLQNLPNARPGDEVVLIGQQGDQQIRAEDVAARWKTNNYEVVSGLAARLPRLYLNPS